MEKGLKGRVDKFRETLTKFGAGTPTPRIEVENDAPVT
jgi:hypothetical protein